MRERADQDSDLREALRRAEPSTAGLLVDRHGTRIYRLARRVLADPRDAEEVTQDVLVTVVRQIRLFKGAAAFASWIYRITANAAYGRSRRSRRARAEVALESEGWHAEPVSDQSREPFEAAVAGEVRTAIERSLAELPSDYRAVILLRHVEGLPNGEVAGILGLSTAAVKSPVHRARLILRKALGPVRVGPQRNGRTV